ncbi:hypothetical protein ACH9L7_01830 [Haloferax sp. S1W]|uniref:hypothetical protein n=1 Tax=Haloferax sp. S1W TaxID=3377110 RepID=UPI0037C7C786
MSRSGRARRLVFFAASVVVCVVLGAAIGSTVGYTTEWTATGAVFGVALSLFTDRR